MAAGKASPKTSPKTAAKGPERPRRTQQERREGTIRKLLDAATNTLIDVGYSEASVQRICARAEVSQGALFRHFPSREALMVAVGEDVGHQLLLRYRVELEALGTEAEDVVAAIRLVRDACRSRLNQAWYELRMAARTNDTLRHALAPVAKRYFDDIERLARQLLPTLAAALGDRFTVLVSTLLATFDGEVMQRFVVKAPRIEEARLELLAGAVQLFGGHSRASR
jgi:AcrR family transcriptional regulator